MSVEDGIVKKMKKIGKYHKGAQSKQMESFGRGSVMERLFTVPSDAKWNQSRYFETVGSLRILS
jgi:hypothetical protein